MALQLEPLKGRAGARRLDRIDDPAWRELPAKGARVRRAKRRKQVRLGYGELVLARPRQGRQRLAAGEPPRPLHRRPHRVRGDRVDQADGQGTRGRKLSPGGEGLEGCGGAGQTREALCAAAAGNEAQLDFRQSDPRLGRGDASVAGQRQLEAAPERGALDGCHDRLAERFHLRLQLEQDRTVKRRPRGDLVDIGAGREAGTRAAQHDGHDGRIVRCAPQPRFKSGTHPQIERVDRWVVDLEQRDVAVAAVMGRHGNPQRLNRPMVARSTPQFETCAAAHARRARPNRAAGRLTR